MSKTAERFYIIAYIPLGSSFVSPGAYAIMHRVHHAYTTQLKRQTEQHSATEF